jgi:hypothetical protein
MNRNLFIKIFLIVLTKLGILNSQETVNIPLITENKQTISNTGIEAVSFPDRTFITIFQQKSTTISSVDIVFYKYAEDGSIIVPKTIVQTLLTLPTNLAALTYSTGHAIMFETVTTTLLPNQHASNIYAYLFDQSNNNLAKFAINKATYNTRSNIYSAALSNGSLVICWIANNTPMFKIISTSSPYDVVLEETSALTDIYTNSIYTSVSATSSGFAIVYCTNSSPDGNPQYNIILTYYDNMGNNIKTVKLTDTSSSQINYVQIAYLGNDEFVITWNGYKNVTFGIFTSSGIKDGTILTTINTGDFNIVQARIMIMGDGYFKLYWEDANRTTSFESLYDNMGNLIKNSNESLLNLVQVRLIFLEGKRYIKLYETSDFDGRASYFKIFEYRTCNSFSIYTARIKQNPITFKLLKDVPIKIKSPPLYGQLLDNQSSALLPDQLIKMSDTIYYKTIENNIDTFTYYTGNAEDECMVTLTPCYPSCGSCKNTGSISYNNCDSCLIEEGYYMAGDTRNCAKNYVSLPSYTFANNQFTHCNAACLTCYGVGTDSDTMCNSCNVGYAPLDDNSSQCYNIYSKPTGYYYNNNLLFVKTVIYGTDCNIACFTCKSKGTVNDTQCVKCADGYFPVNNKPGLCLNQAPNGFKLINGQYELAIAPICHPSCASCITYGSDSDTQCLSCATNYYPIITNVRQCHLMSDTVIGYYFDTDVFKPCFQACSTCSVFGSTVSTQCKICNFAQNYFPLEDNPSQCHLVSDQVSRYFFSYASMSFKHEITCQPACAENSCLSSGMIDDTQCTICNSIQNYFPVSTKLTQCYLNTTQIPGFTFNSIKRVFELTGNCYPSCSTCDSKGNYYNTQCTACADGYSSLFNSYSQCHANTEVVKGFFLDKTVSPPVFMSCYRSCATCSSTGTEAAHLCTACMNGFYPKNGADLTKPFDCFSLSDSVPGFFYYNNFFNKCFSSCASCLILGNETDNQCLVCADGYMPLSDRLSQCVFKDSNPIGYFLSIDKMFNKCNQACENCSGLGNLNDTQCLTCSKNYYPVNGSPALCFNLLDFPKDYILANNSWERCYKSCATCSNLKTDISHNCITCKANYYPLIDKSTECFVDGDRLPGPYYFDNNVWKNCNTSCSSCTKIGASITDTQCTTCADNYAYLEDKPETCLARILSMPGYILRDKVFKKCHKFCKTCDELGTDDQTNCIQCNTDALPFTDIKGQCRPSDLPYPGYYVSLKFTTLAFTPCYNTCKSCTTAGTDTDHKCITCIDGLYPLDTNTSQCYSEDKVPAGFYLNNNKWFKGSNNKDCDPSCAVCTTIAPNCRSCYSGSYLLNGKCIKSADKPSGYVFKDNGFYPCHKSCKECIDVYDETTKNPNCKLCADDYFPLDDDNSKCFLSTDTIQGYYFSYNAFYKCYNSCVTCTSEGVSTNNECIACTDGYFPLEDKVSQCMPSQNTTMIDYALKDNKYTRTGNTICYDSCIACTSLGDMMDHKCSVCNINYYPLEDDTNNCYQSTETVPGYTFIESRFRKSIQSNNCFVTCEICTGQGTFDNTQCKICNTNFYPLEDNAAQCYHRTAIVKDYIFDGKKFTKGIICYPACKTCKDMGTKDNTQCLECNSDYYPLSDKPSQCYPKTEKVSGYIFSNDQFIIPDEMVNNTTDSNSSPSND